MISMLESVYVVILHFGDLKKTLECMDSVGENTDGIKIVVVNNDPATKLKFARNIKVINNLRNLGFAGGNNIGIKFCLEKKAKSIFLLNNDTLIEDDTIPKLLKVLWSNHQFGIVGTKIVNTDNKIWFAGGYLDKNRYTAGHYGFDKRKNTPEDNKVDFISGCAMLVKREVFEKIGLLDERFFLYYEDVDFCVRAIRSGYDIIYIPEGLIYHRSERATNYLAAYYQERNHLLFVEKNAPVQIKFREAIRLPKTLYDILKQSDKQLKSYRLKGMTDYFKRNFGEYDDRN